MSAAWALLAMLGGVGAAVAVAQGRKSASNSASVTSNVPAQGTSTMPGRVWSDNGATSGVMLHREGNGYAVAVPLFAMPAARAVRVAVQVQAVTGTVMHTAVMATFVRGRNGGIFRTNLRASIAQWTAQGPHWSLAGVQIGEVFYPPAARVRPEDGGVLRGPYGLTLTVFDDVITLNLRTSHDWQQRFDVRWSAVEL